MHKQVVRAAMLLLALLLVGCTTRKMWDGVVLPESNVSSFSPRLNWMTYYVHDDALWLTSLPTLQNAVPIVGENDDSTLWSPWVWWMPDETGFLLESSEYIGDPRSTVTWWLVKLDDLDAKTPIATLPSTRRTISWSPTGTTIASFNWGPWGGDITLVQADGSGYETLPIPGFVMKTPVASWSPDGQKIAYIHVPHSEGPQAGDLRTVDVTTHQTTTLYAGVGLPRWFPDGEAIALFGGEFFPVVRADGSGLVEEVQVPGGYVTNISSGYAWAPDGSQAALYLKVKGSDYEPVAIGILDRDTLTISTIETSYFSEIVGWRPDGKAAIVLRHKGARRVLEEVSIIP